MPPRPSAGASGGSRKPSSDKAHHNNKKSNNNSNHNGSSSSKKQQLQQQMVDADAEPAAAAPPAPVPAAASAEALNQATAALNNALSKSWRVARQHKSSYIGGRAHLAADASFVACWDNDAVVFLDVTSGEVVHRVVTAEEDAITAFALSPDDRTLYTAHKRTMAIKKHDVATGALIRQWPGHQLPVMDMALSPDGRFLATGSADRTVRVWDTAGAFVTHNFTTHTSMVIKVAFHPHARRLELAAACDNGCVRYWALTAAKGADNGFEVKGHMSAVTSLAYSHCGTYLYTAGRDSVFTVYNTLKREAVTTVPVFEAVEGLVPLHPAAAFPFKPASAAATGASAAPAPYVVIAGDKGLVRVYDVLSRRCVLTYSPAADALIPGSHTDLHSQLGLAATVTDKDGVSASAWVAITGLLLGSKAAAPGGYVPLPFVASARAAARRAARAKALKSGDAVALHEASKSDSFTGHGLNDDDDEEGEGAEQYEDEEEAAAAAEAKAERAAAAELAGRALFNEPCLIAVTAEHNFVFVPLSTLARRKVLVGFNDDIVDARLIPNTRKVVVATNSPQLRIFDLDDLSAELLSGHSDCVLSVSVSSCGRFITSAAKDNTVRVWLVNPPHVPAQAIVNGTVAVPALPGRRTQRPFAQLVAVGHGHTEAVGAVQLCSKTPEFSLFASQHNPAARQFSYAAAPFFAVSGSRDRTVKSWSLSHLLALADPANRERLERYLADAGNTRTAALAAARKKAKADETEALKDAALAATKGATTAANVSSGGGKVAGAKAGAQSPEQQANAEMARAMRLSQHAVFTKVDGADVDVASALCVPLRLAASATALAHDKDINTIAVAPNDRLVATGSADRTIKVWSLPTLAPVAVLRGHKRGIWALAFSPVDKVLVSAGGDKVLKLWSMADYSCIQTLEGHQTGVLRASFVRRGQQVMSTDSDGVVKLWTIKTSDCAASYDTAHEGKVWALTVADASVVDPARAEKVGMVLPTLAADSRTHKAAVAASQSAAAAAGSSARRFHRGPRAVLLEPVMVTGGIDSTLTVWRDVTEEEALAADKLEQMRTLKEQQLLNALKKREYEKGFELALQLGHPRRLFLVLSDLTDAENRYKRFRYLTKKRHDERDARRAARKEGRFRALRERLRDAEAAAVVAAKAAAAGTGKKAEARAALAAARYKGKTAGELAVEDMSSESSDEDPEEEEYIFAEAKENLELKVVKPSTSVRKLVEARTVEELGQCVAMAQEWNTNAKHAPIAQYLLRTILTSVAPAVLRQVPRIKDAVTALAVYSQRHFNRVNTLLQASYFIDFTFQSMNLLVPGSLGFGVSEIDELSDDDTALSTTAKGKAKAGAKRASSSYMAKMLSLDVDESEIEAEMSHTDTDSDSDGDDNDEGDYDEDEDEDENDAEADGEGDNSDDVAATPDADADSGSESEVEAAPQVKRSKPAVTAAAKSKDTVAKDAKLAAKPAAATVAAAAAAAAAAPKAKAKSAAKDAASAGAGAPVAGALFDPSEAQVAAIVARMDAARAQALAQAQKAGGSRVLSSALLANMDAKVAKAEADAAQSKSGKKASKKGAAAAAATAAAADAEAEAEDGFKMSAEDEAFFNSQSSWGPPKTSFGTAPAAAATNEGKDKKDKKAAAKVAATADDESKEHDAVVSDKKGTKRVRAK